MRPCGHQRSPRTRVAYSLPGVRTPQRRWRATCAHDTRDRQTRGVVHEAVRSPTFASHGVAYILPGVRTPHRRWRATCAHDKRDRQTRGVVHKAVRSPTFGSHGVAYTIRRGLLCSSIPTAAIARAAAALQLPPHGRHIRIVFARFKAGLCSRVPDSYREGADAEKVQQGHDGAAHIQGAASGGLAWCDDHRPGQVVETGRLFHYEFLH